MTDTVGLLHPGEMGATVGAAARKNGVQVVWTSQQSSAASSRHAAPTFKRASASSSARLPTLVPEPVVHHHIQ